MPKAQMNSSECHSYEEINDGETQGGCSSESKNIGRSLRKRKLNLNRLASSVSCSKVCQFQHCGIQLPDDETLGMIL